MKCHSSKNINFRLYTAGIGFPRHADQDEPPIPAKQIQPSIRFYTLLQLLLLSQTIDTVIGDYTEMN